MLDEIRILETRIACQWHLNNPHRVASRNFVTRCLIKAVTGAQIRSTSNTPLLRPWKPACIALDGQPLAPSRPLALDRSVTFRVRQRIPLGNTGLEATRHAQLERQLAAVVAESPACRLLMSIPGIGLLTATAIVAATGGTVLHFTSARHFASWFGLTPKESSSGHRCHLGRISKRGDKYLCMLLTHGARSVLYAAGAAASRGTRLSGIRAWALQLTHLTHQNKAVCALANKLVRVCFGVLRNQMPFGQPATRSVQRKTDRLAFAIAS